MRYTANPPASVGHWCHLDQDFFAGVTLQNQTWSDRCEDVDEVIVQSWIGMISTTVIEINGAAFFYFMCRSTWNEMGPFQHALL